MAQNDTSLPPKVRKSWQNSSTEAHSVNMDPTAEHQWCPEIVDIMAKYGQTPEDFIVRDDEDGADIQDGEQFPTNDSKSQTESDNANTHYYAKKKQKKSNYLRSKSKFEAFKLAQTGKNLHPKCLPLQVVRSPFQPYTT